MARIVCVGHSTFDTIFVLSEGHIQQPSPAAKELCLPFPTKIHISKRTLSVGGNAPNVAAGVVACGHGVKLVSQVGEDEIGQIIYQQLKAGGFDLTYTAMAGESNNSVILSYGQDRTILSYHANHNYQFPQTITEVDWIYLTSLGNPNFTEFHKGLIRWWDKHPEVQVVYNPGGNEVESGFKAIEPILKRCHTLILNKEEAAQVLREFSSQMETLLDITWLLEQFIKHGVKRIIITDGKQGSYFSDGLDRYWRLPTYPSRVIDTTGAGDAFSSGYLSGVAHNREPLKAMLIGVVQSGHAVETPGAVTDLLTLKQIDEILSTNSTLAPERIEK